MLAMTVLFLEAVILVPKGFVMALYLKHVETKTILFARILVCFDTRPPMHL